MAKKAIGTRTYILELKNGEQRKMTFPSNWKLTFGNVLPYQGKDQKNSMEHRIALRVYGDSKEDLRAVLMDVVSFRDSSIGVQERRTNIQRKGAQVKTEHGMKDVVYEAKMTEWVDPDKEDGVANGATEYKALTKHKPEEDGPDF